MTLLQIQPRSSENQEYREWGYSSPNPVLLYTNISQPSNSAVTQLKSSVVFPACQLSRNQAPESAYHPQKLMQPSCRPKFEYDIVLECCTNWKFPRLLNCETGLYNPEVPPTPAGDTNRITLRNRSRHQKSLCALTVLAPTAEISLPRNRNTYHSLHFTNPTKKKILQRFRNRHTNKPLPLRSV